MKNLVEADISHIYELKDKIADLSNEFYEIIPEKGHVNKVLPFLDK